MLKKLTNLNARLCRRYELSVTESLNASEALRAGLKAVPKKSVVSQVHRRLGGFIKMKPSR
jgi:hypothetical protein